MDVYFVYTVEMRSRDDTTEKFLPLQTPTLPAPTRQPPIFQLLLQKRQWQLELLDS